jgi:hypothetical protein
VQLKKTPWNILKMGTGFSIELVNWRLEYRGMHKGLSVYESLGGEVTAIAIVNEPAIGVKAKGNDKEKIIAGLVMIPDLKMFRNVGPNGPENCYWYFSASTIKELQQSFKGEVKFGH